VKIRVMGLLFISASERLRMTIKFQTEERQLVSAGDGLPGRKSG
jgi:hypothetical protein